MRVTVVWPGTAAATKGAPGPSSSSGLEAPAERAATKALKGWGFAAQTLPDL